MKKNLLRITEGEHDFKIVKGCARTITEQNMTRTRALLLSGRGVPMIGVAYSDTRALVVELDSDNTLMAATVLRTMASTEHTRVIYTHHEAWIVTSPMNERITMPIRDHPDRIEALVCYAETAWGERAVTLGRIVRDDHGVPIDVIIDDDARMINRSAGRLTGFFKGD